MLGKGKRFFDSGNYLTEKSFRNAKSFRLAKQKHR